MMAAGSEAGPTLVPRACSCNTVDALAHQTEGIVYSAKVLAAVRDMVLLTDVDEVELRRKISLILASGT